MRIAIASEGKDKSSIISLRATRIPFLLLIFIFENKKLKEAIKNSFAVGGKDFYSRKIWPKCHFCS